MKKTIIFAATFAFASLMTSCEDSDEVVDITAPEITEFEMFTGDHDHEDDHDDDAEEGDDHDHEDDHIVFHMGETVTLEFAAEDESLIQSWKLNIHFGEGHSHNHREVSEAEEWNQDFTNVGTGFTPAQSVEETLEITIKEDIAEGEYHAVLFVIDEHGNETKEYKTIEIHGEHDHEEEAH